jgi:hypothetical protein
LPKQIRKDEESAFEKRARIAPEKRARIEKRQKIIAPEKD